MKYLILTVLLLFASLSLSGCIKEDYSTSNPQSDSSENMSHIDKTAQKGQAELSLEDCRIILSTPIRDLAKAYKIDLSTQPSGGLLLPGRTVAGPTTSLVDKVFISTNNENGDWSNPPVRIVFYGEKGSQTIANNLTFGMHFNDAELKQFHVSDSFFKTSETGDQLPAKLAEVTSEGLHISVYFTELKVGQMILEEIEISLE